VPTRADIEAATPRCRANWPDAFAREVSTNFGLSGGILVRATVVLRICLRPMRYLASDNTWVCDCGAGWPGLLLSARAAAFVDGSASRRRRESDLRAPERVRGRERGQ
jgi:hypothetical protein